MFSAWVLSCVVEEYDGMCNVSRGNTEHNLSVKSQRKEQEEWGRG